jgi:LysW-gamma-L-lysine carboxypeptidase
VDAAGNAVGIRSAPGDEAPEKTVMLLGHIDTVPGVIPVRVERGLLFGRGSVDAKGPLATLVLAGAALQIPPGVRLVVAGAVEEEVATSRGARQVASDWRGDYCVIGEPGGASGIVLGYKGRALVDFDIAVDEGHTAGAEKSGAERAADFWFRVRQHADEFNRPFPRMFDQLMPSLRGIESSTDGLTSRASARIGVRLPPEFDLEQYGKQLAEWADPGSVQVRFGEPAWQSDRTNLLVRSLGNAIRHAGHRPVYKLKTGTADLNVVGPVWNCPIVAYGPGDSSLDHTPGEHLELEEFLLAVRILQDGLQRLVDRLGSDRSSADASGVD